MVISQTPQYSRHTFGTEIHDELHDILIKGQNKAFEKLTAFVSQICKINIHE